MAIDGATAAAAIARTVRLALRLPLRTSHLFRSFAAKFAVLILIFLTVPVILYVQFRSVDAEKNRLVLINATKQGRLIAQSLLPQLENFDGKSFDKLSQSLSRLNDGSLSAKLLYKPLKVAGRDNFFYVASSPVSAPEYLEAELKQLVGVGVIEQLRGTCEGNRSLAIRFTNPRGAQEVLTSLIPVTTLSGCWVLLTSHSTEGILSSSIGQPYWMTPQVQIAASIYVLMAFLVIYLFLEVWRGLRRFEKLARDIRTDGAEAVSFSQMNQLPELKDVAVEFDRMVHSLQSSADLLRRTADENAHAFKTPIAIIAHSLDRIRRGFPPDDTKGRRAAELIEQAVDRLDALVSASRRLDEAAAETLDPPRERVKLSALMSRMVEAYSEMLPDGAVRFVDRIDPGVNIIAGDDLMETVIENLLDNAISFSPKSGEVRIELRRNGRWSELSVMDRGPGVAADDLDRIFDRYYTERPDKDERDPAMDALPTHENHFGVGLWIVRRNVEAVGGTVFAQNRIGGGLKVTVRIPVVK